MPRHTRPRRRATRSRAHIRAQRVIWSRRYLLRAGPIVGTEWLLGNPRRSLVRNPLNRCSRELCNAPPYERRRAKRAARQRWRADVAAAIVDHAGE